MERPLKSYVIEILRNGLRYGFDFQEESSPYKKYAVISKVSSDVALKEGLKVGDKVICLNGISVVGKDYVALRNNMRKSENNCVKLEILNCRDSLIQSPEPCSISPTKMVFEYTKRILVPDGSIREKISFFQNDKKKIAKKRVLRHSRSNSCGCLPEMHNFINDSRFRDRLNSTSMSSKINIITNDNLMKSNINSDIVQPISQDPFEDDSFHASCDVIQIPISYSSDRVIRHKSYEHIKDIPLVSTDQIFQSMPEPFEKFTLVNPSVPKIEISNFQNTPSISMTGIGSNLSPEFPETMCRSSTNLFEDVSISWTTNEFTGKHHTEYSSLVNITSDIKRETFPDKKLIKQHSILESIPIKLRIIQFREKIRSKSWKDYILERTESGVRFRKRLKSMRHDKANNFEIKADEVNSFTMESPQKRQRVATGAEILSTDFSVDKYELMTSDNHVHLKFFFNPTIFQDATSSNEAHTTYKEIIEIFRKNYGKTRINDKESLSEPTTNVLHLSQSHGNFSNIKETKRSNEELSFIDLRCSTSTSSFKSNSKSSVENISNPTSADIMPPTSKNIFKQAMDKIKPEKKVKSYEVFTGTKAEYEEFKRQLEGGNLPVELDTIDESGINFNRFIHEVPRMINTPRIPMVIYLCTEIVEKIGLQCEGIYRISGNQRVIRTLSTTLNKSLTEIDSSLAEWSNVHAVCGTLKLFLRKLKQNLIPADLSHVLAYSCKAVDCDDPASLSKTLLDIRYHLLSYQNSPRRKTEHDGSQNIEDQLDCRWQTLQYLLRHLAKVVSYKQFNSMDEHALSVCFNPVVMESWQKNLSDIKADNEIMIKALELILIHQDWLFNNWDYHIDVTQGSELIKSAFQYAKNFIESKYYLPRRENEPDEINSNDVNVCKLVCKIINQATMEFGQKKKLERRHSSHLPGHKNIHVKDETDTTFKSFTHRNSKVTEALDLSTCINLLKSPDKVPTIEENKKIKVTYISSSDSLTDCEECHYDKTKVTFQKTMSRKEIIRTIDSNSDKCETRECENLFNYTKKCSYE